jgi:hypothetical protein
VALGLVWLAAGPAGAQDLQWTGHLAAATELSDRGLVVGPRRPTLQASLTAALDQRWTLGLSASAAPGAAREGRVLGQIGRYQRLSDDWQVEAGLGYYAYPGNPRAGKGDRWELTAGASWRDLFSGSVTALHYPAWPGQRAGLQWALDLAGRWPIAGGWSATASLGRADLPVLPDRRYRYAGLGLAWQDGRWRVELNRLGSDATARAVMGQAARPRWSASALVQF